MLINLSNHPSESWTKEQKEAALKTFGEVSDLPFPKVDPTATTEQVAALANDIVEELLRNYGNIDSIACHIMGEQCLCYALINLLQACSIRCYASTRENDSESVFRFVAFREYNQPDSL